MFAVLFSHSLTIIFFQPFSRGFHKVCGGEALTLFRAEELELVICGSNELVCQIPMI